MNKTWEEQNPECRKQFDEWFERHQCPEPHKSRERNMLSVAWRAGWQHGVYNQSKVQEEK